MPLIANFLLLEMCSSKNPPSVSSPLSEPLRCMSMLFCPCCSVSNSSACCCSSCSCSFSAERMPSSHSANSSLSDSRISSNSKPACVRACVRACVCVCVCVHACVRACLHARVCPFHFTSHTDLPPPIFIFHGACFACPCPAGSLMQGALPYPGLWAWASHCHAFPPFASS